MPISSFLDAISSRKHFHLIGIGGVSMSALAQMLSHMGARVSGSDREDTAVTRRLRDLGIAVYHGHDAKQVGTADVVIRTSAIAADNPEYAEAARRGILVCERAEAWGALMRHYQNVICLAGTHGKTTTTSMMGHIAMAEGVDPTIMVGSKLPSIDGTLRIGSKEYFIAESCEYCNSFLSFTPTVAVLLNIEADHLDFFEDLDAIIESFRSFCLRTPEDGILILNGDDENVMRAASGSGRKALTFGLSASYDVFAENVVDEHGYYHFDVMHRGERVTRAELSVPGKHNMLNALACCAAAIALGFSGKAIFQGLHDFTGASRRFEKKGMVNGALVVDDYAHHPSEMVATLKTARQMNFDRIVCVFQPHTYSRTKALFQDFLNAFPLADIVVLADIYAAREQNKYGISSKDLADHFEGAEYYDSFERIEERLSSLAQPGDLILTMGAGDIYKVAEAIAK